MSIPYTAALLIIDVQHAIDHPKWMRWGPRNNPQAEDRIAQLLAVWRATQRPIIHVRHMSREPQSPYRPQQPGNEFKPQVAPLPQERIVEKSTNSAFIGTTLEADLHAAGIDTVIITGVIYTGRDMAHKYMVEGHKKGEKLPGLYPPNEENKKRYEDWKKKR